MWYLYKIYTGIDNYFLYYIIMYNIMIKKKIFKNVTKTISKKYETRNILHN